MKLNTASKSERRRIFGDLYRVNHFIVSILANEIEGRRLRDTSGPIRSMVRSAFGHRRCQRNLVTNRDFGSTMPCSVSMIVTVTWYSGPSFGAIQRLLAASSVSLDERHGDFARVHMVLFSERSGIRPKGHLLEKICKNGKTRDFYDIHGFSGSIALFP